MGTEGIIDRVEADSSNPIDRLTTLFTVTTEHERSPGEMEVRMRSWATEDPLVADTLARIDARRIGYVTELFMAAGVGRGAARRRAQAMFRMLLGGYLWQMTGGPAMSARARTEIIELFTRDPPARPG